MNINIDYTPNDRQYEFHSSNSDTVIYGGAKGGGKSCALVMECLAYGLEHNNAQMYIFRETYDDLEANIIREWKEKVPKELYSYHESKHNATLINGTVVKFRYIRNFADAESYQGRSMDWIGVDELTKYEKRSIQVLLSCLRSPKGYPPRFRATCNPGGIGHVWVKEDYIEATEYGKNKISDTVTGGTIEFIPAKVWDNVVLMDNDPNYVKRLQNLPEAQRKAFLDGDWDIFDGQFFDRFKEHIHVIDKFRIPKHWKRYRVFDYGLDMFAVLFIAVDERDNHYVYKEINQSELIISEAAELIRDRTVNHIDATYAPPDMWNRRNDTGKSAFDLFASNGVNIIKADNNRSNGCASINEALKHVLTRDQQTGDSITTAKLKIFRNCTKLVSHLKQIQTDEKDVNVYATTPHELTHNIDALRYYCIMRVQVADKYTDNNNPLPQALRSPKKIKSSGLAEEVNGGFEW